MLHDPINDGGQWDMVANLIGMYVLMLDLEAQKNVKKVCYAILVGFFEDQLVSDRMIFVFSVLLRKTWSHA